MHASDDEPRRRPERVEGPRAPREGPRGHTPPRPGPLDSGETAFLRRVLGKRAPLEAAETESLRAIAARLRRGGGSDELAERIERRLGAPGAAGVERRREHPAR